MRKFKKRLKYRLREAIAYKEQIESSPATLHNLFLLQSIDEDIKELEQWLNAIKERVRERRRANFDNARRKR